MTLATAPPSSDIVLAITGGSGAPIAIRLLDVLLDAGATVHLVLSPAAAHVCHEELGITLDVEDRDFDLSSLVADTDREPASLFLRPTPAIARVAAEKSDRLKVWHRTDFGSPIASGSFRTRAMVACPCSMGSTAAIAHGFTENLVHRAAHVHLKERRPLILVPREAPLPTIALRNLTTLSEAGATIVPAAPGWYHEPRDMRDLVDFVVARIVDLLGVDRELMTRWGSEPAG